VDAKFHQPGGEWEVEPTRPKLVGFVGINTGLLTKNRYAGLSNIGSII
jgi:hypothetical protein